MSGIDKTRDELFSEYFENREGSAQVAEHAYRQGWKDRETYTVVPAAPTQGADARPVAIFKHVDFPTWWDQQTDIDDDSEALARRIFRAARALDVIATRDAAPSDALNTRLAKFLDVAAGEGYVFDGIDAGELFLELFPDYFKDTAIAPRNEI